MAEMAGIDFSRARPDPRAVVQSGYRFVMGYLSRDAGKNMTPQLAQACLESGDLGDAAPAFHVTKVTPNPDPRVYRQIDGTVTGGFGVHVASGWTGK